MCAETMTSIDCTMPLGGIIAMKPLVIHSSSKSRTGKSRRVLHSEYAASPELGDGLELAVV